MDILRHYNIFIFKGRTYSNKVNLARLIRNKIFFYTYFFNKLKNKSILAV